MTALTDRRGWAPGRIDPDQTELRGLAGMLTVLRAYLGPIVRALLAGIVNQGAAIAAVVLGASLVARAAVGAPAADLVGGIWLLLALVLLRAGASWLEAWTSHELAFRILAEVRTWLYDAFERLAPGRLQHRRSGDLVARAMSDSESMEMFYAHTLIYAVAAFVLTPLTWIGLAVLELQLALSVLPVLALTCWGPFALRERNARHGARLREEVAAVNAEVTDAVQGLREIVSFGAEDRWRAWIDARTRALARAQHSQGLRAGGEIALVGALVSLGILMVAVSGAGMVRDGALARVDFPVVVVLSAAVFTPIVTLFNATKLWGITRSAADRVFELLEEPAPVPDDGPVRVVPDHTVRFEDVTFAYNPDGPPALRGMSCVIAAGETVALVGHSGAGKSTAAHLLQRFWDVQEGRITIGGVDLRDLSQITLHDLVAFVAQDVFLFNDPVRDNVVLGVPDAEDAAVAAALADAQAGFVATLPDGPDTVVGERGARLSGGERQRLSIARALLRDAPILILDESVANLGTISEQLLTAAISRARTGRTALVIAHRLSTILSTDRIVLLEDGRVVDHGTHRDLMGRCQPYRDLVDSQMDGVDIGHPGTRRPR